MVFLAAYNYTLVYLPGKLIAHMDALSCRSLPVSVVDPVPAPSVLLVNELQAPLTTAGIMAHSLRDPILAQVLDWVGRGWLLGQVAEPFLPFWFQQHDLSVQQGCLLWGNRVVVPPKQQPSVLECLYDSHPGIVRMKGLSRSYVW